MRPSNPATSLRRGDLVWANLEPTMGHEQSGRRPVLVVSNDLFNARSGTVICMPVTTQKPRAGEPFTFELPDQPAHLKSAAGSPASWVKISQIRTLSTARLSDIIKHYPSEVVSHCLELLVDICTNPSAKP